MIKMLNKNNFNISEFKNGNIAIHCDTVEKARQFIDICHKNGLKWPNNETGTNWRNADKTCYRYCIRETIDGIFEHIAYSSISVYEEISVLKIFKWELI